MLRKAQRRMLRIVLGAKRKILQHDDDMLSSGSDGVSHGADDDDDDSDSKFELEPWVDWIRRATHEVEN